MTVLARTLARCPVCAARIPVFSDGRVPPHPWVEPVVTIGWRSSISVFEFRGWCPGEGLRS